MVNSIINNSTLYLATLGVTDSMNGREAEIMKRDEKGRKK